MASDQNPNHVPQTSGDLNFLNHDQEQQHTLDRNDTFHHPDLFNNHNSTFGSAWLYPNHANTFQHSASWPYEQRTIDDAFVTDHTSGDFHASNNFAGAHDELPQFFGDAYTASTNSMGTYATPLKAENMQSTSVAPQALHADRTTAARNAIKYESQSPIMNGAQPFPRLPKGLWSGRFSTIPKAQLQQAVASQSFASFLYHGTAPADVTVNKISIPAYVARKSRKEMKRLMTADSSLSTTVAKKVSKPAGGTSRVAVPVKLRTHSQTDSQRNSSSGSESDSELDSSDDDDGKIPLPAQRPTTAVGITEYDTIKAVWGPHSRALTAAEIKAGLQGFWNIVQTIRDRWKSDSAALKEAEEAKKTGDLPLLKERLASQRTMLHTALNAIIKHAHPDVIRNLSQNIALFQTIAMFLHDRAKELDYDSEFSQAMLKLLSLCDTLTSATLADTKTSKVLERFAKRGKSESKILVKRIVDNGVAATKKRKEGKPLGTGASITASEPTKILNQKSGLSSLVGVKRSRPVEGGADPPAKKPTPQAGTARAGPATKSSVLPAKGPAAPTGTKTILTSSNPYFSGLSAVKRPAASAPAGAPTAKKPSTSSNNKPATQVPAAGLTFAQAFASLNEKPKPPEPVKKPEIVASHETDEEKAKRLHREGRRKLRVSWKPDDDLVSVKYFMHDPDEEVGHDANQVRDVLDTGSEGRMFKYKAQHKDDEMDVDDEDETASSNTHTFDRQYNVTPYDMSLVPEEDRERLYAKFGGPLTPDSTESAEQQRREGNVLMAVYATRDDVPLTPKSPPPEPAALQPTEVKNYGEPPQWLAERGKAFKEISGQTHLDYHMRKSAAQPAPDIASILDAISGKAPSPFTPPDFHAHQPASQTDVDKLLASITGYKPQPVQQSFTPASDDMSATLAKLLGNQPVASQPPAPAGYKLDSTTPSATTGDVLNDLIASLQQSKPQSLQPSYVSAPQQYNATVAPPPPPPPMMGANGQVDLSALISSLQSGQAGGAPAMPTNPQDQSFSQPLENAERRRMREQSASEETGGSTSDGRYPWNHNPTRQFKDGRWVPTKVLPCKYWKLGKCKKGDDCTFIHDGPPGVDA